LYELAKEVFLQLVDDINVGKLALEGIGAIDNLIQDRG
jgi:hypothetical protein